ncbi:MAG: DUF1697 domain-containing protein [Caulobacteraceae bacterium]
MTSYVALLRAVNVGGTGKLPMADLLRICAGCGFSAVETFIASGNVVFDSDGDERAVKTALAAALERHAGKPIGVLARTGPQMAAVLADNPFADRPPNRTVAIFLDAPPPRDTLAGVTGRDAEEIALGRREIYVAYGEGMSQSRLRIAAAAQGTARNMNTVARLARMARRD